MLAYMEEGTTSSNPSEALYVVNNTFVNSHAGGAAFVYVDPRVTTPAILENNFFVGPGGVTTQTSAIQTTNYAGTPSFVNSAAYDYHLLAGSPGIDAGTAPGSASGFSLAPVYQYLHPTCGQVRLGVGTIDIGAFEYNGAGPLLGCVLNPVIPTIGPLVLSSTRASGGSTINGNQATLTAPAGPQGEVVTLASSDPHATVPPSVTVPAGATSTTFPISASPVSDSRVAVITGSLNGQTSSANLTITPIGMTLASVTLQPSTVGSGAAVTGTVTLTAPAPAGGIHVALASASPVIVFVPAYVTVPQGATTASFPAAASIVSKSITVGISASYADRIVQAFLTVQPWSR
jgi:hypothetical protein